MLPHSRVWCTLSLPHFVCRGGCVNISVETLFIRISPLALVSYSLHFHISVCLYCFRLLYYLRRINLLVIMALELFLQYFSLFSSPDIRADGALARLHYQFTFLLMLIAELAYFVNKHFDSTSCTFDSSASEQYRKFVETLCRYSSFVVLSHFNREVGVDVAAPGIGNSFVESGRYYLKYYPWVAFVLLILMLVFLVPRYLWMNCGLSIIKRAVGRLYKAILNEEELKQDINQAKYYFKKVISIYPNHNSNDHCFHFRRTSMTTRSVS